MLSCCPNTQASLPLSCLLMKNSLLILEIIISLHMTSLLFLLSLKATLFALCDVLIPLCASGSS